MAAKQAVRPLKQGDLIGICGVYAIINATKYLFPKDQIDLDDLFAFILTKIDERNNPKLLTVILNGMSRRTLVTLYNDVLREYVFHIKKDLDMVAEKKKLESSQIGTAVQEMKEFLDRSNKDGIRRIIIVCIDGKISHWTCITRITDKKIELFDGEIKSYNISKFHITKQDGIVDSDEFYICKDNVIFLETYRG
ncbi:MULTISPECIES: hypothetical protein [Bacteria]|jgi:hypothetical protein|uniref:Uncharacterized protein n=1 Tax=Mucispirillum schaedleri ASF457 TaxID=1379858 RepID=V2RKF1_9BACT|nr:MULTISPECIES: hypothetical protein [Bacteria]MCX4360628.1 hypothetical protein [Mucispirillum schaedleri]USF24318.1 hypothetical protein N508_001404 [Mucispirillum schaedleri ASF457]SIW05946.1 conserved hypothetical protein [Mucispirillum schaedleri ASF457]